jgi:hypothetical protein
MFETKKMQFATQEKFDLIYQKQWIEHILLRLIIHFCTSEYNKSYKLIGQIWRTKYCLLNKEEYFLRFKGPDTPDAIRQRDAIF